MDSTGPFSNGKFRKNLRSVGELVDELNRFPRDTSLGDYEGVDIVVLNHGTSDEYITFDDWPDDESDED